MKPSGIARRTALVMVAALLVAGCATDSTTLSDSSSGLTDQALTSAPATEGTGPETPQESEETAPSISVPTLPVGGDPDVDGLSQCAHANWLGSEIPPGVEVSITGVSLDPDDVFSVGGDLCGSGNSCADSWTWTADNQGDECTVAVTQQIDSDQQVTLVLDGTVTCSSQSLCDEFENAGGLFDGSQITFTAELGLVTPSDDASVSDSAGESASSSGG